MSNSARVTMALLALLPGLATAAEDVTFEKITLSREFESEGACFADINDDGISDVVSGGYWYEGPRFTRHHRYAVGGPYSIKGYSDFFFVYSADFDNDGDSDILSIPMPGTPAFWHENPGNNNRVWPKHLATTSVGGESPSFIDITGDGKPELVCIQNEAWGYVQPNWNREKSPWKFTAISDKRGLGRFTHGQGIGDVDMDGRLDLLERTGWWQQGDSFQFHKFPFAESGGSQMFAYDVDGDGDNDIISVQNAHAWGLKWFERRGTARDVSFIPHEILPTQVGSGRFNVSQMHALALADMDGDGVKDIVTGKRYFAHNGNDPGAHQLPLLVWFKTIREAGSVRFEPHVIDKLVGVGTQLTVEDMNGDKRPDIVVGNKRGTVVFVNQGTSDAAQTLASSDTLIGGEQFKLAVRETEPLPPADEARTFVLPHDFKAELVVAEPDIGKPMNLAFDTRGRLWVSSSIEYPWAAPADREGRDTIKVLEDANGDGHYDKVTTFADQLNVPIGLYPYKDGVICFSIPNIWFLRDTNGDGQCDKREKLYGPMGFDRDTHGLCNAFTRGYDGWLYACHGFNNHTIVAGTDGHEIKMQSGNTFRMRLDGARIEHFTHGQVNPFGMVFDESGDQFSADCHTKPVTLLMRGGYYDSFGKPHDGLGYVPDVMEHLHGSTAIGGIAQLTDASWPAEFRGNTFGGNVMTSRVNRNSIRRTGSTVRAREEPDFMLSGDPWFRPVDLQFGPNGSLYVADFYNRIIGHYEVDLKHPGRDRTRGRVWKISYVGPATRAEHSFNSAANKPALPREQLIPTSLATTAGERAHIENRPPLSRLSPDQLVAEFTSSNLTRRMLAADQLVDYHGDDALNAIQRGALHEDANTRIHSLWCLVRLDAIKVSQLRSAMEHRDERVRTHAARMLEAVPNTDWHSTLIAAGLGDSSPMVRRATAIAATVHPERSLIPRLLATLRTTPPSDVHLRHALRMAIRDHLRNKDWFEETARSAEQQDVPVLAGICLALRTEHAGEFLARNLNHVPANDATQFAQYVKAAARYTPEDSVDLVVATASQRFSSNTKLQLELLRSIDRGLKERGTARSQSLIQWASSLATMLLALDGPDVAEPLSWQFVAPPGSSVSTQNPWQVSTRRKSADGLANSRLFSSFPTGEQQTGMYRSAPFTLANKFHFWMAGHDGVPNKPPQRLNFVRLRDAKTHTILKTWWPPRNDTAQQFTFDESQEADTPAYLELVDGDTANAFAWLAVGRFSNPRLNPGSNVETRREGIALVEEFQLTNLRDALLQIVSSEGFSIETIARATTALAALDGRAELRALAMACGLNGISDSLRKECVAAVVASDPQAVTRLIPQAMKTASAAEQLRLGDELAGSRDTIELLVGMLEDGHASAQLLAQPSLRSKLDAIGDGQMKSRVAKLLIDLPSEAPKLDELIANRINDYLNNPGDRTRGAVLFTKNCAICHQVAGKGAKVGPNLDGIGTRGLNRLTEDVLAPNRNVDVNFRATTVLTDAGKAITGLLKPSAGATTVIVNSEGKEVSIQTDAIEDTKTSRLSPMPANVTEQLTKAELRDLMAYLLSLGS